MWCERAETGERIRTHCEESLLSTTIAKILSRKQKYHSHALSYFKLPSQSPPFLPSVTHSYFSAHPTAFSLGYAIDILSCWVFQGQALLTFLCSERRSFPPASSASLELWLPWKVLVFVVLSQ